LQALRMPEELRFEIDATGGAERQQAKRKYLKRLVANLRPDVMRQWYDGRHDDGDVATAPGLMRKMTDEERARWFPEGWW
jgi:hypothetical protein